MNTKTIKLATGEIVLANNEGKAMAYGNRTQAEQKREKVGGLKVTASADGKRFHVVMEQLTKLKPVQGPGRIWATRTGPRVNPRNRHHHSIPTQSKPREYDTYGQRVR